jgi:hypothetical protein
MMYLEAGGEQTNRLGAWKIKPLRDAEKRLSISISLSHHTIDPRLYTNLSILIQL